MNARIRLAARAGWCSILFLCVNFAYVLIAFPSLKDHISGQPYTGSALWFALTSNIVTTAFFALYLYGFAIIGRKYGSPWVALIALLYATLSIIGCIGSALSDTWGIDSFALMSHNPNVILIGLIEVGFGIALLLLHPYSRHLARLTGILACIAGLFLLVAPTLRLAHALGYDPVTQIGILSYNLAWLGSIYLWALFGGMAFVIGTFFLRAEARAA